MRLFGIIKADNTSPSSSKSGKHCHANHDRYVRIHIASHKSESAQPDYVTLYFFSVEN